MDYEVSPAALRRAGAELRALADAIHGDLVASYHATAPDRTANPGWAGTAADDAVASAAGTTLTGLSGRARALADALADAARAYELADESATSRLGR